METAKDIPRDLEKHRLQLEENVAKLKLSLCHWQAWEIEYESLKEEVLTLGADNTSNNIKKVENSQNPYPGMAQKFLLTAKEKREILRYDDGRVKSSSHIDSALSRRLEYVRQSIKTISSQLHIAEKNLSASLVVTEPEGIEQDGLPLMEIEEELDEDGNVISSKTSEPGENMPEILNQLNKAGVIDGGASSSQKPIEALCSEGGSGEAHGAKDPKPNDVHSSFVSGQLGNGTEIADRGTSPMELKKRVSFAEDVQEHKPPVIPDGESPEDALLRQQMLRYNMEEVGAVVAEIDLDEDEFSASEIGSDLELAFSDGEDDLDDIDDSEEGDEGNEDIYGRTSSRVLTDDYVAEMRALEKRLGAQAIFNVGPSSPGPKKHEGIDKLDSPEEIPPKTQPQPATNAKKAAKKGVRFADDLDIKEILPSGELRKAQGAKPINWAETDRGPIVENLTAADQAATIDQHKASKVSRFKSARNQTATESDMKPSAVEKAGDSSRNYPTPPDTLQTDKIIERNFPWDDDGLQGPRAPSSAENLNFINFGQQVRSEYNRLRNRQIQREGGFSAPEEEVSVPLAEEEGGPKKVSRFKSARLGRR